MRNKITALIFLGVFFMTKITAQDTTFTRFTTEKGTLEQQTVETEADRLFGTKVPARWMMNITASPYYSGPSTSSLLLGAEYKIRPGISTGIKYNYAFQSSGGIFFNDVHQHYLQLEQRWYPQMTKKAHAGTQANNFSGTYVGLRTAIQYDFEKKQLLKDDLGNDYFRGGNRIGGLQADVRYGIQRRLRKHGIFDYSAGISLNHSPTIRNNIQQSLTSLSLNQEFRIGLAVFERRKDTDYSGAYCGILRCFEDNRWMVKVNTMNLLNVFYQDYSQKNFGFNFNPNIAIEQKLFSSPFSIEIEADINLSSGSLNDNATIYRGYSISQAGSLRWYYNQPKRIAAGRSGNNLSGPFVAIRVTDSRRNTWTRLDQVTEQKFTSNTQALHALWGYQLRIFKHGYAAFRIGPGLFLKTIDEPSNEEDIWGFNLFSDLRVGFAF